MIIDILPWKVFSSFLSSNTLEAITVLDNVSEIHNIKKIKMLTSQVRKRKKIKVKTPICIKKTEIISKFKKYDGFIFKPIENNKSSTPISAGMLNIELVSFKSKTLKIQPEKINPTKIGNDKSLKICPHMRAPVIQKSIISISIIIMRNC